MSLQLLGDVGEQSLARGVSAPIRLGPQGELIVQEYGGRYMEIARQGRVFSAVTAAVAPGTALSTTPPLTIYNPVGSKTLLVLLRATLAYASGTLGAGAVMEAVNIAAAQAAPTGGTALAVLNGLLQAGANSQGNKGQAFSGATLPAAPTAKRPAFSITAELASTAVQNTLLERLLEGDTIIAPGMMWSMQEVGAGGSTPLVFLGADWAEIPE